jgi:dihydrodipicolinate synthase/N-acetylneuraminate lyase
VYGPTSSHGFKPSDDELRAYFREVLSALHHEVALAPNPVIGYTPKPGLLAGICDEFPQVVAINLAGLDDSYFIDLKHSLNRDVDVYVPITASWHTLHLGAAGLLAAHANIIPRTFRTYLDAFERDDAPAMNEAYDQIQRFARYVTRWPHSTPRWIKMAMRVLRLPGGEGGLRPPYLMPSDAEVADFERGLLALEIPEITEMAALAGAGAS